MANNLDVQAFNESIQRCLDHGDIFARFYEIFLSSSKEVQEKFAKTDMKRQRSILKASIFLIVSAARGFADGKDHIARIAASHSSRGYDIKPILYDLWLESLLQAAGEFDPEFDEEVEAAWRSMLSPVIEIMKGDY